MVLIPKDIVHTTFLMTTLLPLATAILNIRTVPILSDPAHHNDMFLFCLSLTIGYCLYVYALFLCIYRIVLEN